MQAFGFFVLGSLAWLAAVFAPPIIALIFLHRTSKWPPRWALTVTKNWRMTFRINAANAIEDMDLEDYH